MSMFDELFSASSTINEQISRDIFEIVPEDTFNLVMFDFDGNAWASDLDKFNAVFTNSNEIAAICDRLDDGANSVLTTISGKAVMASDLRNGHENIGYVFMVLQDITAEKIVEHYEIYEFALKQMSVLASKINKNNSIHHRQLNKIKPLVKA